MCTVTFIPSKEKIYLTSNRDEKHWRAAAMQPEAYPFSSGRIFFPKDGDAGGTWFALHENGNAAVFLNGGFIKHEPNPPYRKSRGVILLDILNSSSPLTEFEIIDLNNIEPFTAIIWEGGNLTECRWDGKEKFRFKMDVSIPHIWASCTLYDDEVIAKRKSWFAQWLKQHPNPTQDDILHFHVFTGDGDAHNDLVMNRDGKVFTVSVTSAAIDSTGAVMQYLDTQKDIQSERNFDFTNATIKA